MVGKSLKTKLVNVRFNQRWIKLDGKTNSKQNHWQEKKNEGYEVVFCTEIKVKKVKK